MAKDRVKIIGAESFRRAIARNPIFVTKASKIFLVKAMALYKKEIRSMPWAVGTKSGGGVPIDTGNLRDTHRTVFKGLSAKIYPTATYSNYVHGGTNKMDARPWLDHAKNAQDSNVKILESKLIDSINKNLAS